MGKLSASGHTPGTTKGTTTDQTVAILVRVAEAMAALPDAGAPLGDARLIKELADRLLDDGDPLSALVRDALDRVLDDASPTARSGALALAEMLRELQDEKGGAT